MKFQTYLATRLETVFRFGFVLLILGFTGCLKTSEKEVVVYAALDKEFSEPILEQFQVTSGITVLPKYDQESNKTVGLANTIINQQNRPRADLFWNNEILHSLRLKKLGLLEVHQSPLAEFYPASFVSPDHDWHGFAARARVLIVNTDLIPMKEERPSRFRDLVDPKWKGKCAMAYPLFGTTATHAAVVFSQWGNKDAEEFFRALSENASIESGNKQVAQKVANGRYAFGITDTDDAIIEVEKGAPVAIVFPDQAELESGTLLIPNTLCLIKNGPNTEHARRLIDYLLGAEVEAKLAQGASAQIPLHSESKTRSRVVTGELKVMKVDFEAAAEKWDDVAKRLSQIFPVGS